RNRRHPRRRRALSAVCAGARRAPAAGRWFRLAGGRERGGGACRRRDRRRPPLRRTLRQERPRRRHRRAGDRRRPRRPARRMDRLAVRDFCGVDGGNNSQPRAQSRTRFSMRGWFDLSPTLLTALGGIFGLLVVASFIISVLKRARPERDYTELVQRTKSWWLMAAIFTAALLVNRVAALVFLGIVSFLALKEYLSIIPTRRADRRVLFFLYLAIPIQFYWVSIGWYGMFIIFVPVYMLLFLPLPMLIIGETQGFLRAIGTLHWGLMVTVFSLSHAAYTLMLPAAPNAIGEWRDHHTGAALMIYLVVLTQLNDVAQYVWGKLFGAH